MGKRGGTESTRQKERKGKGLVEGEVQRVKREQEKGSREDEGEQEKGGEKKKERRVGK